MAARNPATARERIPGSTSIGIAARGVSVEAGRDLAAVDTRTREGGGARW